METIHTLCLNAVITQVGAGLKMVFWCSLGAAVQVASPSCAVGEAPLPPRDRNRQPQAPCAFAPLRRRPCSASDVFGNLTHAGYGDYTSTRHFRAFRVQIFCCLTRVFPVASEIFWVLVFNSHLHFPQRTSFNFLNDSSNSRPFPSSDYTCLFLWGCGGSAKLKLNKYRQWVRGNTKV